MRNKIKTRTHNEIFHTINENPNFFHNHHGCIYQHLPVINFLTESSASWKIKTFTFYIQRYRTTSSTNTSNVRIEAARIPLAPPLNPRVVNRIQPRKTFQLERHDATKQSRWSHVASEPPWGQPTEQNQRKWKLQPFVPFLPSNQSTPGVSFLRGILQRGQRWLIASFTEHYAPTALQSPRQPAISTGHATTGITRGRMVA